MKTQLCSGLLALAITVFALPSVSAAGPCDGTSSIAQATGEYRQVYDPRYAAAQQIAATTEEYRQFYDPRYAASRQIAQTTSEYCAGNR
ncbi:MAG TPA: hypothetical protein VFM49_05230 [Chloroflexia bacterium]|jgi:hypothetical protein|nr:hypothetical protein [Chloroflexia bacterium]